MSEDGVVGARDAAEVLALLHRTVDAVAEALGSSDDWGLAGTIAGQHRSDLVADAAALAVLAEAGVAVLSEESGRTGPDHGPVVVLDPLDGSTNASRRMGWWATSLCVVDEQGPWVAVVGDLRHGPRYQAVRGGGATRDGAPIAPSGCTALGDAIVGLNGVPAGHGGWAQYRAFGAAALDLCAVADGTLDAYLDATVDTHGVWDYLGAVLVCREAGAEVADAAGRDLAVLDHGARRTPVAGATAELQAAVAALHPARGATGSRLERP